MPMFEDEGLGGAMVWSLDGGTDDGLLKRTSAEGRSSPLMWCTG